MVLVSWCVQICENLWALQKTGVSSITFSGIVYPGTVGGKSESMYSYACRFTNASALRYFCFASDVIDF